MKHLLATLSLLIVIAAIIVFTPTVAHGAGMPVEKVPMISVEYVQMGNSQFGLTEQFQIHQGKSVVERTASSLNISFANNLVSPINDTLSFNDSIHLSKNQMTGYFPSANGTIRLIAPPQQSYLDSMTISGNSSYSWLTIVEVVPVGSVMLHGSTVNGTEETHMSGIYNVTMDYAGSSYVLHSPGLVYVGSMLRNVSLFINNTAGDGRTLLSFSFPITDGSFNVVFNQILTSSQQIDGDVMSYFQVSPGFQSPLMQNIQSDSISIGVGVAIFLMIILGLFIYYRRK